MWAAWRQMLVQGLPAALPTAQQIRSFKVVSALRRRCTDCRIVRRGKKIFVLCNENPRHKQRQGKSRATYRLAP